MPTWVKDENIWDKAKKAAAKAGAEDLYALTTYIYKKMGGEIKPAKEADKTGVKTTHWFWGCEAFAPKAGKAKPDEAKPEVVDQVEPPTPADAQAQQLLIDQPDMPAATMLNALKAKGLKLVDEKAALEADSVLTQAQVARAKESCRIKTVAQFREGTTTKNPGVGPIRFKVALIQEGMGNLKDAFFYSKDAINSGIQAFEGRKCYADHPSMSEEQDRPERSVRDIIGHFESVQVEENDDGSLALVGDLVMPPDPPFEWARALVRQAAEYNKKYPEQSFVGLSINASGDAQAIPFEEFVKSYQLPDGCKPKLMQARENGMETVKVVSAIKDAVSCDLVTEPGAKGKILNVIESERENSMKKKMEKKAPAIEAEEEKKMMMAEEDEEQAPKGKDEEGKGDEDHADEEQDKKLILDMIKKHMGGEEGEMEVEAEEAAMEAYQAYKEMGESEDEAMKCAGKAMKLAKHMAEKKAKMEAEAKHAEAEEEKKESEGEETKESERVKLEARIAFLERELKARNLAETLDAKLKESGLGRAETDRIRALIGTPKSEAEIIKTISIFKEAFSARGESSKGSGFFVTATEKAPAPAKKSKVSFGDCV